MATGTVQWFNEAKGVGYITPDNGGEELFVHHSCIRTPGVHSLKEAQKVSYVAVRSDKGPKAMHVMPRA